MCLCPSVDNDKEEEDDDGAHEYGIVALVVALERMGVEQDNEKKENHWSKSISVNISMTINIGHLIA